jgi:hypothetical protein
MSTMLADRSSQFVADRPCIHDKLEEGAVSKVMFEHTNKVQSLGSVRLRDRHTGDVVLIPTPTNDPNDPLVSRSLAR